MRGSQIKLLVHLCETGFLDRNGIFPILQFSHSLLASYSYIPFMSIRPNIKARNAGFIRFSPLRSYLVKCDQSTTSGADRENVNYNTNIVTSKDGNLNEIAERVRLMEKLVKEAIEDESANYDEITRHHNNELEGILHLLKSNFSESINELLVLLEEERTLREETEAELEATRQRWKTEVTRTRAFGSPVVTDEEARLRERVAELEAECGTLKLIIKDGKISV
jgi:hypothetical protein